MQVSNVACCEGAIDTYALMRPVTSSASSQRCAVCSDEEAADPLLVPPPILDPFVLYHLKDNATSADGAASQESVTKAEQ